MSITALPAATRAALEHLIDYAGLFPPAQLSVEHALATYDAARRGPHAWMLGRFIVPLARLHEMPADIPLSVIVPASPEAFEEVGRARKSGEYRIEALEIPPAHPDSVIELRSAFGWDGVPVYLETPAGGALTAHIGAKLRCGGLDASAYPNVVTVARFIAAASVAGIPFKATAGLHHPVRHFNAAAGVTMHGFLNVLAAAVFPEHAEAIIAEEDPRAFTLDTELRWREQRAQADDIASARASRFIGYGSCSFDEPVEDLRALGILAE